MMNKRKHTWSFFSRSLITCHRTNSNTWNRWQRSRYWLEYPTGWIEIDCVPSKFRRLIKEITEILISSTSLLPAVFRVPSVGVTVREARSTIEHDFRRLQRHRFSSNKHSQSKKGEFVWGTIHRVTPYRYALLTLRFCNKEPLMSRKVVSQHQKETPS